MLFVRTLTDSILTSKDLHNEMVSKIKHVIQEYFHLCPQSIELVIDSNNNGGDCIAHDISKVLPFKKVIVNKSVDKLIDNTTLSILSKLHSRDWERELKENHINQVQKTLHVSISDYIIGITTGETDSFLLKLIENHKGYGIVLNIVTGSIQEYPPIFNECLKVAMCS
jgi:hypothetical protein